MAITTVDDIVSALASNSQSLYYYKAGAAAKAAGSPVSTWLTAGKPVAGGTPPAYTAGSGYTCDKTTSGAIPFSNGATQLWAALCQMTAAQPGVLYIYDRLWACSGMGFAAGTYTVTTPGNLPARITDNGVGVEAFVEQSVAAGAASGTLTLNYLNANTGAAKSGVIAAVVSSPLISQLQPIPLAAGDTGVRQVTSAVNSATWTSGSFGILLAKRLFGISFPVAGAGTTADWAGLGLPKVPNDACLFGIWMPGNTTASALTGGIGLIDK